MLPWVSGLPVLQVPRHLMLAGASFLESACLVLLLNLPAPSILLLNLALDF